MIKIPKLRQDIEKGSRLVIRMTGSPHDFIRKDIPSVYEIQEVPEGRGPSEVAKVSGRKINVGNVVLGYCVRQSFEWGDNRKNVGYAFTAKGADQKAYNHAKNLASELSDKYEVEIVDSSQEDISKMEEVMQEDHPGWKFHSF